MTPFRQIPLDVQGTEANHRQFYLSLPDELFREQFGGRIPERAEKMKWIEEAIRQNNPDCLFSNDMDIVGLYRRPPFIHLDIHRHDGGTCKGWRDFQQIKNIWSVQSTRRLSFLPQRARSLTLRTNTISGAAKAHRIAFRSAGQGVPRFRSVFRLRRKSRGRVQAHREC